MRSAAANFHLTWQSLPVVKEMGGLGDVSFGFDLATKLLKFSRAACTGPRCIVHFGVQDHLGEELPSLEEVDTWTCRWLCPTTMRRLGVHIEELSGHSVFNCGRSFYFEGFEVVEKWSDNGRNLQRVDVSCRWGS